MSSSEDIIDELIEQSKRIKVISGKSLKTTGDLTEVLMEFNGRMKIMNDSLEGA